MLLMPAMTSLGLILIDMSKKHLTMICCLCIMGKERGVKGMTRELPKHLAEANLTYVSHSQLEKPACLRIFEYLYLKDERATYLLAFLPRLVVRLTMQFSLSFAMA
jgi:hypothetical protein